MDNNYTVFPINDLENLIIENVDLLVESILNSQFQKDPELKRRFSANDIEKSRKDAKYNITQLLLALEFQFPEYFINYVAWLQSILTSRQCPKDMLPNHLIELKNILIEKLENSPIKENCNQLCSFIEEYIHSAIIELIN